MKLIDFIQVFDVSTKIVIYKRAKKYPLVDNWTLEYDGIIGDVPWNLVNYDIAPDHLGTKTRIGTYTNENYINVPFLKVTIDKGDNNEIKEIN